MSSYHLVSDEIHASMAEVGTILAVYNGWSRGSSFISKAIRYLDIVKFAGKKYKSAVNHVYRRFVFDSGISIIFESHIKGGIQINSWTKVLRACKTGKVTGIYEEKINLDSEQMAELWNRYLIFEGDGYDRKLILLYYLWHRTGRLFTKLLLRHRKSKFTCNEIFIETGKGIDPLCKNIDLTYTPERLILKATGKPSQLLKDGRKFRYNASWDADLIWVK